MPHSGVCPRCIGHSIELLQHHHQQQRRQLSSSSYQEYQHPTWFGPLPSLPPVMPLFGSTSHQVSRSVSQPVMLPATSSHPHSTPTNDKSTWRRDGHSFATRYTNHSPPAEIIILPERRQADHQSTVTPSGQLRPPSSGPVPLPPSMAVLYPQTARGLVGVDITKPAGESDKKGYGSTLPEGLGKDSKVDRPLH